MEPRSDSSRARTVVVMGTGTDVGKTYISCLLLAAARRRGLRAVGWKPVATGVAPGEINEDAVRHALASGRRSTPTPYCFEPPVSPHLAAARAGVLIDGPTIAQRAGELARGEDLLVVEGAGGLFTPLAPGLFNADLVRSLEPSVWLLVGSDRLGVLHDVVSATRAASAMGLPPPIVVLFAPIAAVADASTGRNADELLGLGIVPVALTCPRLADGDATDAFSAALLARCLAGPT